MARSVASQRAPSVCFASFSSRTQSATLSSSARCIIFSPADLALHSFSLPIFGMVSAKAAGNATLRIASNRSSSFMAASQRIASRRGMFASGVLFKHLPANGVPAFAPRSECDLVGTFERENVARLVGRCDCQPQAFDELAHLPHLRG